MNSPRSKSNADRSNPRQMTLCAAVWVAVWAFSSNAAGPESPVPKLPITLFNGTNLNGFTTWLVDTHHTDPRHVFSVTNAWIRISGEGLGYLATTSAFANYHLIAEFRWGRTNWSWGDRIGKARDAGVFLHAVGPEGNSYDGQGAFKAAIECNVFEGATGDFLLIRGADKEGRELAPRLTADVGETPDGEGWPYWKRGGRSRTIEHWGRLNWFHKDRAWKDVTDFRGANDVENPPGEWNELECICASNRISIHLNGTLVNQVRDVFPSSGQILLQCEGSEVFFRRLELLPLKSTEPAPEAKP